MCLILSQCLVKQRQSTSSSSLWNNNCSHKHLTLTVSQPWLFLHSQAHYFTKNSTLCQACPGCGHRQLGLSLAQDLLACGDLQEAETRHSTLIRCQRLHTKNKHKKNQGKQSTVKLGTRCPSVGQQRRFHTVELAQTSDCQSTDTW